MANKKVNQLTSKPAVNLTDLFLIADPTSGQAYKTTISDLGTAIGSGVSSVNSLVGAVILDTDDIQELVSPTNKWFTDTRARAAISASSPLTYNSGTGAFGIQVATGSQNGYLSSTDWTTFNSKQAALSGTGFVKSTGGTISYDTNTYLTTTAAASTYLALGGGTMTGVLFGASASFSGYVGFNGNTSPLYPVDVDGSGRFSGDLRIESTNPRIYLTDTDNNPDYFISNTDGTFTVYDVTNSTSRFTIGTTGNAMFANAIIGGGSITGTALYSTGIVSVGTYLVMPANNTIGGTNYYIGQTMADNDYWRIYGNTVASDQGELVFHLGDNASSWSSVGQRFRFFVDNASSGTAKSLLTIDYDTASFTTAINGTSSVFSSSVTSSDAFISTDGTNTIRLQKAYFGGIDAIYQTGTNAFGIYLGGGAYTAAKLYITNGGNVGIGTTAPLAVTNFTTLTLNGTNASLIEMQASGTSYARIQASSTEMSLLARGGVPMVFYTNPGSDTERMRITSAGIVSVNSTSPNTDSKFFVKGGTSGGDGYAAIFTNNAGSTILALRNDQLLIAPGVYSYNYASTANVFVQSDGVLGRNSSSLKYKKNIIDYDKGLDYVLKLRPVLYESKNPNEDGLKFTGFIAEEVDKIGLTELVHYDNNEPDSLHYPHFVALLTKSVQEQQVQIQQLKAELNALKA